MPFKWFSATVRKLWSEPSTSITGAAVMIAVASLASRLLGVFRDRVLASMFGAGDVLDVYYAAFKVPDLLYNLLIVGALSAGFIPIFIATRDRTTRAKEEHWHLVNSFMSLVIVGLVVGAIVLYLLSQPLASIVAPGFSVDKVNLVSEMMRVLALSPLLLGVSAVVGGVLQSYRRFFVYSIAPIFYNIGIVVGALFFVEHVGVVGLAWGVVLGALLHLLIQLPTIYSLGWRWKWKWDLRNQGLREIGRLMVPRTLALALAQLNIFFLTIVASFLSTGSVAVFHFASNLFFVPVALFGISYALASFPELSEAYARGDMALFKKYIRNTVRSILFLIIPATVLYLVLRAQIVRGVLGSGAFDWTDTVLTFETLYWLSLAMFAHAIVPLFVRVFYAAQNTLLPLLAGLTGDVLTIATSVLLSQRFDVAGLAMAFSLGAVVQVVILFIFIAYRFGSVIDKQTTMAIGGMVVAGVVMAFVAQGLKTGLGTIYGTDTFIDIAVQALATSCVAILAYVTVSFLFHSRELMIVITALKRRLRPVLSESLEETEGL